MPYVHFHFATTNAVAIGLFINYQEEEEMKKVKAEVKLAEEYSSNHYYNDGNGIKFWNENNTEYIKLAIKSFRPNTIIVNGEAFMSEGYDDNRAYVYKFNYARLKVFFDFDYNSKTSSIGAWDITMIQYSPHFLTDFKTYYNKDLVIK